MGVYTLCTDTRIHKAVWTTVRKSLIIGLNVALAWGYLSYGVQKWYVNHFFSKFTKEGGTSQYLLARRVFGIDVATFATWGLILSQATFLIDMLLYRSLRRARSLVFDITIETRGGGIAGKQLVDTTEKGTEKPSEDVDTLPQAAALFGPYVEEYKNPPSQKVITSYKRQQKLLTKGGLPLFRFIIRRFASLSSLVFPILGTIVVNYVYALPKGTQLHQRLFALKGMQLAGQDQAKWIAERRWNYTAFGWVAGILESIPIAGSLFFSMSNQVGAALWALELEQAQRKKRGGAPAIEGDNEPLYKGSLKVA